MTTAIITDLPCAHCGYNLRAQPHDGACPECGAAVADALANPLHVAKAKHVDAVHFGLWCAMLAYVCLAVDQTIAAASLWGLGVTGLSADAGWLLAAAGVLLLLCRIRRPAVRHGAIALYLLMVVLRGRTIGYELMTINPWFGWVFRNVSVIYVAITVLLLSPRLGQAKRKWFVWLAVFAAVNVLLEPLTSAFSQWHFWRGGLHAFAMLIFDGAAHVLAVLLVLHMVELARICRVHALARFGQWVSYSLAAVVGVWMVTIYGFGALYMIWGVSMNGGLGVMVRGTLEAVFIALPIALTAAAVYAGMLARHVKPRPVVAVLLAHRDS